MKQLAKVMLLALGFGILAVVLSTIPNHPAAASGSAPVTVVNTPNVNVANSPTVSLASGTSVGINGSVSVANLPTVQNVSFNGATQPVTLKNQLVTLVCNAFTSNLCTDLEQVAPDGTLTPYTAPPSGSVLVVTDFVWKAASVTPGQVAFATLHHQLTSPPHDVSFSAAVATPDGAAVSESHFTSGLLFSDVPIVFISDTPNVAILRAYLATP
jgi:hypothetical protein